MIKQNLTPESTWFWNHKRSMDQSWKIDNTWVLKLQIERFKKRNQSLNIEKEVVKQTLHLSQIAWQR